MREKILKNMNKESVAELTVSSNYLLMVKTSVRQVVLLSRRVREEEKLTHSEHFILMQRGGGVTADSWYTSADTWHRVEAAAKHYGLM